MIRVVHVLWSGGIGGAERATLQLVREQMRDPGLEVGVVFAQGKGHYYDLMRDTGCTVSVLDFSSGLDAAATRRLSRTFRDYDLHHFQTPQPAMVLASVLSGRRARVYTHRGGERTYAFRKRQSERVMGVLLRRYFHGFSGNTAHAVRVASGRHSISEDRFCVTYNGLDPTLLEPSRARADVRREMGVSDGTFVVGTAAHLREIKRIDRLVEAVAGIQDDRIEALIVGEGPARARLERLSLERGAEEKVLFAGAREDVVDYMAAMDAFVLPTGSEESFGNAAVEAMALSVPTIVFADGGGLREHVEDGSTGFVVDDEPGLVSVIRRLATDEALCRRVGSAGSLAVRDKYCLETSAAAYKRLYSIAMSRAGLNADVQASPSGAAGSYQPPVVTSCGDEPAP